MSTVVGEVNLTSGVREVRDYGWRLMIRGHVEARISRQSAS